MLVVVSVIMMVCTWYPGTTFYWLFQWDDASQIFRNDKWVRNHQTSIHPIKSGCFG